MAPLEHVNGPPRKRRWLAPVANTLGAWVVAFLVVLGLLSLLGRELGSLPLAPRALIISGLLVALMANLVMPVLSRVVARLLAGPTKTRPPKGAASTQPAPGSRAGDEVDGAVAKARVELAKAPAGGRRRADRGSRTARPAASSVAAPTRCA